MKRGLSPRLARCGESERRGRGALLEVPSAAVLSGRLFRPGRLDGRSREGTN